MMWNPWMFGLEAVQQGWQAQSALAFRLMRSFAGGVPDQTTSSPLSPHTAADDIKAHCRNCPRARGACRNHRRAKGACRNCRCATSQSPEGFAGLQEDISREVPERIKTGGG
jgi:hypothetical protein